MSDTHPPNPENALVGMGGAKEGGENNSAAGALEIEGQAR